MRENFYPFALEREMSIWENQVKYNISESGVQPMSVRELLDHDPALIDQLLDTELNYVQANGILELRENIAALYPGATEKNVLVTTGAAQANFTAILTHLDPGEEIVVMLPNYMQIYGVGINYRLNVRTFSLKEELNWGLDIDELNSAVTDKTRLIAICNPNNPSGHILTTEERKAIVNAADRVGAWILSDEVYAGAEHTSEEITPSFWGDYDRVYAIGSLSKAYALPGLRIGWVVAPEEMVEPLWARQDYITISTTMLGNKLAAHALVPKTRARLIQRTRQYVRSGYRVLENWVQENSDLLSVIPPQAAAIAFVRYHKDVSSTEIVQRLIHEEDTYVVPGSHFGLDQHLRISYGLGKDYVEEGLRRVLKVLRSA